MDSKIEKRDILIVNYQELSKLPPVLNLIEILVKNHFSVSVITIDSNSISEKLRDDNILFYYLSKKKENHPVDFILRKRKIRALVKEQMEHHRVIWTTTDITVREIGKLLFQYAHIMQLMELVEDLPYFPGQKLFMCNLEKYAKKAKAVVVPEYNRAHILQSWWNLDKTPYILPNKNSVLNNSGQGMDPKYKEHYKRLKNEKRKIILYQGILTKERPLEPYAKAIEMMKERYCFCIMGDDINGEAARLKEKYECVITIPFINPPQHLFFTNLAYIGILSYHPVKIKHYSILNALYCAPNKIYEYCGYGIPVIGNDIPGIRFPVELYGMGHICKEMTIEDIRTGIECIEENYDVKRENCLRFYEQADLNTIICDEILKF